MSLAHLKHWLDSPTPDSLPKTLDRLSDIYNAGISDGSITPIPDPAPIVEDYGQISTLAERYARCLAFCSQRGLATDTASLAHQLGEPESAVNALQQQQEAHHD